MNGGIILREAPPELDQLVHEAIQALGYFRADRADELAALYRQLWPRGTSDTMLIYNDLDDMSEQEKRDAGLGRGRMPRAVWQLLTDKGKRDPRHAAKATGLRLYFRLRLMQFDADEVFWSTMSSKVQFMARAQPEYHCPRSLELAGLVLPRQARFPLPLPDCAKEWCPCRWVWVPDWHL